MEGIANRFDYDEYMAWLQMVHVWNLYGHNFGDLRPSRQGMNHTAPSYRVCKKCGLSDVYIYSTTKEECKSHS